MLSQWDPAGGEPREPDPFQSGGETESRSGGAPKRSGGEVGAMGMAVGPGLGCTCGVTRKWWQGLPAPPGSWSRRRCSERLPPARMGTDGGYSATMPI